MATLLTVQNLNKAVHHRTLFRSLSLSVSDDERIGLVGPNGAGKSTLLRILSGADVPDDGELNIRRGLRVGYLAQEDVFPHGVSALEALLEPDYPPDILHSDADTQARILLDKLGFADAQQPVAAMSGGWRKRLAIGRVLLRQPDLLLLDEPTNHLDLEGIVWLEELLNRARFAFILCSHDRYLLENVANRIVEINPAYPGGCYSVDNRYSVFLERRDTFLAGKREQQHILKQTVKREIEWMKEGRKAQRIKDQARIQEAHRKIDQLADLSNRNRARVANIEFDASGRKTRKLLTADEISKSLGGRLLFQDLSLILSPGSRVGLVGANGAGKTTLIRVLTKELPPDSGRVTHADDLKVVLFDQQRESLPQQATLPEALAGRSDHVEYRGQRIHVSGWAQRFHFSSEQFRMQVADLSGGEQARILIARLMLKPADVLILDEPTNNLDFDTLDVLEESLLNFPGALVLVSHDRYLLDRVCTELICLDGDGGVSFLGSTQQWEVRRAERGTAQPRTDRSSSASAPQRPQPTTPQSAGRKLTFKEQRELDGMEAAIAVAESKRAALQAEADAAGADFQRSQQTYAALAAQDGEIERLYARWAELEARSKGG